MYKFLNLKTFFIVLLMLVIPFTYQEVQAADYSGTSYGVVNFRTKSCGVNTSYTEFATGRTGYTNGCYGADGAFLGMSNGKVKFMLSGVIGLVDASEVTVIDIPKYDASTYISSYRVQNGNIQHCVSLNTSTSSFSCYSLGKNTVGLKTGTYYLSYDGHYFYEYTVANFKKMIDDYKNGVRTNAYNKTPYYNYYQFVTHRTQTNQGVADFNSHIKIMANSTSKMYNLGSAFISSQNTYGSNGALMYSVAGNESAWGLSGYAINRNNLFGHSAYDSDPDSADYYNSPSQSVAIHAEKFISEGYLDPCDWSNTYNNGYSDSKCLKGRYNGGHLGNKASGINVRYASDPYWGEKAASNYYNLESSVGTSDYGYYTLGIKTSYSSFNVRKEPSTSSTVLYKTTPTTDYPFVILGKVTGSDGWLWYKIQTDPTLDSTRSKLIQDQGEYNFNTNYGYVRSDAVNIYIAGTKIIEDATNVTYNITFNANGGKFSDNTTSKVVNTKVNNTPSVASPTREGYTFAGWSPAVTSAVKATTYTANWTINEYDVTFDANGGTFDDKTKTKVVKTKYNELPTITEPSREDYVFAGWSPTISKTTKATTYKAVWEEEAKADENGLIERNGEFYLNSLEWNEETKKYSISGYQIILNTNNLASDDITYTLIAKNRNTDVEYELEVERWLEDVPFELGVENGFTYDGAWFKSEISFSELPAGDYELYMQASNDKYYSKSVVSNLFNKSIKRRGEDGEKGYSLIVNLKLKSQPISLSVRDDKLITTKEAPTYRNMINNYDDISFDKNNNLHVVGTSYNYGGDYSNASDIERKLILENTETFKQYEYDIGATNKGSYNITSTDKLSKDYSWYDNTIDISNLPKGTYSLIVYTKTKTVEDYGEVVDMFAAINSAKADIDEKVYQIKLNKERNNRIELQVS